MKMKHTLSMVLLSVVSLLGFAGRREEVCNAVDANPLPNGMATVVLEAAVVTKHLLLAKGTATKSAILCTAALNPLGPCGDEGAIGDRVAVALLGAASGTRTMIASKAIAENTQVYSTAGGKITDAVVSGAYWVGKTAPGAVAAADGDPVEVIPRFPRINP